MNPAMPLPWTLENVPHAILDILRGCNIRCPDCFNTRPNRIKSLSEVTAELDALQRRRKLHSVSIVGGEVTLHPELIEIVRMVKSRGLFVELFSNGVELTSDLLERLKKAGVDVIFVHIEKGQRRPDLQLGATSERVRQLRNAKAELIAAHGMEAGLAVTVYPDRMTEVEDAISFTLESPHVFYLLITLWRDSTGMPKLEGDIESGMRAVGAWERRHSPKDNLTNLQMMNFVEERFQFTPFAFIGSNTDQKDPRWVSYMIGSMHASGQSPKHICLKPTIAEKLFLELSRRITGHYPFYMVQRAGRFVLQLLLNGLAGGGIVSHLRFLINSLRRRSRLSVKRLLFQCPAEVDEQGQVIFCESCPDAVMSDGKLVPLCLSDCVTSGATQPAKTEIETLTSL